MYIRKRHVPRTEPWGMPNNTGQLFDVWLSTTTLWNLCDNHAPIKFDVLLFIPMRFNLRISLWWSTLSKALEKSIMATSVCLPLAMLSKISWVNVSNCVSQLLNWVLIWSRAEVDIISYECLGGSLWRKELYVLELYRECMWGRLVCNFLVLILLPF